MKKKLLRPQKARIKGEVIYDWNVFHENAIYEDFIVTRTDGPNTTHKDYNTGTQLLTQRYTETSIIVTATNTTVDVANHIEAHLTQGDGTNMANETVIFTIQGVDYEATTNSNGIAVLNTYTSSVGKTITVEAKYPGDNNRKLSPCISTTTFTVGSLGVTITHNKNSVNAYDTGIQDSDNFNFTLRDEKGNLVNRGNLEIFLQPTYYKYVDIVQPISVQNLTVNAGTVNLNAVDLISSSLKSYFRNRDYNYYLRYNVTVRYTDSTGRYNTCTTMSNELYVWYLVKEPTLELKVWSKQPSSNTYSLIRDSSITEFGEDGDVSNNTPLNVPANADIKVQLRILDTDGNNIGGVGYHKWITHEHDITIYVQDEETGEFRLTQYGNKIPHTTLKRTIRVEQAAIDPDTGEEIFDPDTGEQVMELVDVETPILMNPCYAGIPLPEPTLFYTEDPFEIFSYSQNNVITFRLPEEVHGESTMFIGLSYYALGIFGMFSNTVVYPNESFMGGLDSETHEYLDPKTHRYGVIMNIEFNSP